METLERRSNAALGPFMTEKKLCIAKIGEEARGSVHQLCAPTLSNYDRGSDSVEISSVPNEITLKKGTRYILSSFVSSIEYAVLE